MDVGSPACLEGCRFHPTAGLFTGRQSVGTSSSQVYSSTRDAARTRSTVSVVLHSRWRTSYSLPYLHDLALLAQYLHTCILGMRCPPLEARLIPRHPPPHQPHTSPRLSLPRRTHWVALLSPGLCHLVPPPHLQVTRLYLLTYLPTCLPARLPARLRD